MKKLARMIAGVAVLLAGGAYYLARQQGFSARAKPSMVETWAAHEARAWAMPKAASEAANPVADTPEVLTEAREHWADHCAGCHANNGSGDTPMGSNMYPPAPDMRQTETQALSDGALFFIIENGVRLTGMPGWGNGTAKSAEASWKLVRFIRHLPVMTADEELAMKKLNPKSPAEFQEEKEIEEFLKGEDSHAK